MQFKTSAFRERFHDWYHRAESGNSFFQEAQARSRVDVAGFSVSGFGFRV